MSYHITITSGRLQISGELLSEDDLVQINKNNDVTSQLIRQVNSLARENVQLRKEFTAAVLLFLVMTVFFVVTIFLM